ncbi:MAG: hypothetical protein JWN78_1190 [Bacteroidota bacterium]|nr:hypothetical protein [Bacteroidota bacterium]
MKIIFIIICLFACLSCKVQQNASTALNVHGDMRDTMIAGGKDTLELSAFLVDYLGEYTNGKVISAKEQKLYYREINGGKSSLLNRVGKDVFHLENSEATIRFFRNNFNQVMSFRIVWLGGRKEFCERKGPVYISQ